MKRISFKDSDGLCLTQAVLSGRKTMTRRAAIGVLKHSPYKVGDVVAIQQAYKDVADYEELIDATQDTAGWTNKMFVAASLMPHHIRITDVRVERLQDISNEDCLREGIIDDDVPFYEEKYNYIHASVFGKYKRKYFNTPRAAFAALIDKVSGRGTWNSNPLVWVYSFELID